MNSNDESESERSPDTTADAMRRSLQAWNDLLSASTDLAFGMVLKNWDYSRSLRHSTEQAVADALRTQQRLSQEMLQAWQGLVSEPTDAPRGEDPSGER